MDARFGFMLFDNETTHDTGWALRDGESILRVSGTSELSSDTVWWTNLSYETANLSGLQGARFRRGSYFAHETYRIWQELGLDETENQGLRINPLSVFNGECKNGLHLRLMFSVWMFRKMMEITEDFMPIVAPPLNDLAHGLRERIFPEWRRFFLDEPPPEYYQDALQAADKSWQPLPRIIQRGDRGESDAPLPLSVRLPVDRVYHGWTLLSMPIPAGGWRSLGDLRILNRRPHEHIREWLIQNPGALIRVTMKSCDDEMESIVNYGGNIDRNARSGHWLTSVELESLMDYCEFVLHEGVTAEKIRTPMELIENAGFHLDKTTCENRAPSYPFHIFMDNIWRAMAGPIPRSPKGARNPAAAFLRSADRMMLMQKAIVLHKRGIRVTGYGSGGIMINPPKSSPEEWIPDIIAAGLIPPMLPAGTLEMDWVQNALVDYEPQGMTMGNTQALQMCCMMGDLDSLMYLADELSLTHANPDSVQEEVGIL